MKNDKARGFLEAILARPDDDTPRLIYADWLEEQGDTERAEFIRVQILRASLPEWDRRQVRLAIRERELSKQHYKWNAELPDIKGVTWMWYRRGFMAQATFASFTALASRGADCWAAAPIETVSVSWPRPRDSVECSEPINGLRELKITGRLVNERDLERLADSPLLSTLRTLDIRDSGLGVSGFRRLMASPHPGKLTALRVPYNSIGNSGIAALFDAASLNSLGELDLSEADSYGRYDEDPNVTSTGLVALAGWPGLARLRSLKLSGNDVQADGLRALLRSPLCAGLKELALRDNRLNGQAVREFGDAHKDLRLETLDLAENLLGDLGAAYLASAPCLRELKVLDLERCEMPVSAARQLATATFRDSLRRLNVNSNSFGPEGLDALFEQNPVELHTLRIAHNDLGDTGIEHLAASPASDTLLELDLDNNGLGDDAVRALAASNHLRYLLILRIKSNRITKPALEALRSSPLGQRLAVQN
jgi:uncharacterized protein (TIGR02996 family)